MNSVIKYLILLIGFIFGCSGLLFAQDNDLETKEIVINKDIQKVLPEAARNFEKINFDVPREQYPPQKYVYDTRFILQQNEIPVKFKIPAVKDEISKIYGNYLKAGFGNYVTPYLQLYIANKRKKYYTYGIHIGHNSSKNGPVINSGNSSNLLEAFGRYYSGKTSVSAGFKYNREVFRYYGYQSFNQENKSDSIKQIYHLPSFNLELKNSALDSTLNYSIAGDLNLFKSTYISETEIAINHKAEYLLKANSAINWNIVLANITKTDNNNNLNRYFIKINPYYVGKYMQWQYEAGFNTAIANDTTKASKSVYFYPHLIVKRAFLENRISLASGLTGDLEKRTYRNFTLDNPFLSKFANVAHTNNTIQFFVAAEGNIQALFFWKVKTSYGRYKNMAFFANNALDSSRFDVIYDHAGTELFQSQFDFGLKKQNFNITSSTKYNLYKTTDLKNAYHKPALEGSILSSYTLKDKIYFNLDFYYICAINTVSAINKTKNITLDNIFDLNCKVDYKLSERSSLFIAANNILSKKYQRYLYYQNRGINILAGASFNF